MNRKSKITWITICRGFYFEGVIMEIKKIIKEELKQIKYYYRRKKNIEDSILKAGLDSNINEIIAKYNRYVSKASILLQDIYLSLYVKNYIGNFIRWFKNGKRIN